MNNTKHHIFEYIVFKLREWYASKDGQDINNNDLSLLKVFKLHFFVCAINSENDSSLLDTFDNFHALPYGPVESDIYNSDTTEAIFNLTRSTCKVVSEIELTVDLFNDIDEVIRASVDESIKTLKDTQPDLVLESAGVLVELSHLWDSWRMAYQRGKRLGRYSYPMSKDMIKEDEKIIDVDMLN
ncbi:hypothetical protein [Saccharicrinis aurantiacus]|uniref:hypothetical protein n=1 Tax=Saccharicrinis aurantiacus TaxID=1849719 RepID=UPI00248FEB79|nr:hypothetical protein [Saccharicrinis aurantiacus]